MSELVQGALYPAVRSKDIRSFVIPIAPLAEQKRIADKLEAVLGRVDACRARLDRVPALLKRFRQSVLTAATSGRLTEEWRMTNGVNHEWKKTNVGALCHNSFYGPRFGKNEYTSSANGIPTVRTTDMTKDGRIEITAATPRVLVSQDKLEHFRAIKGDLLVTRTGSIGVMAIFDEDYAVIPSAYLIRFRFDSQVLPRYVYFCLASPYGQECLGFSATAITQPNINAEAIKRIKITLPTLPEQQEIVRRVDILFAMADRIEARLATAQKTVERLTPATLAKAFRGELVPQDPSDEPASRLLERLTGQSFAKPAKAKRTKRATRQKS
jgi:type I restriction enzyme S subunit